MTQESLANPGCERGGAAPAVRGRRRACIDLFACAATGLLGQRQWSIDGRRGATLMRHEVDAAVVAGGGVVVPDLMMGEVPLAPAAGTLRVRHAPGTTALVARPGRPL